MNTTWKTRIVWLAMSAILAIASNTSAQQLTDKQREGFRAAKTARVVVKLSYENAPGFNLSLQETTRAVLKHIGPTEVHPYEKADLTFEIFARGSALSRSYRTSTVLATLFTGASVQGTISVIASGISPYIQSFHGEIDPPEVIFDAEVDHYKTRAQAPFDRAFFAGKEGFLSVFAKLLSDILGDEALASAFVDEDEYARIIGLEALVKLDVAKAVAMSIAALRQPNAAAQKAGETAFSSLAARPEALDLLLMASKDSDGNVRRAAIFALGEVKDDRARDVLIQGLNDADAAVRSRAANRLVFNYDRRATEPLIIALKDSDARVRHEAAAALKGDGVRAIEPLIVAIGDKDSYVRFAAAESLRLLTREDFGENLKAWQKWWKANKRTYEDADLLRKKAKE